MTAVGDALREFALAGARYVKDKKGANDTRPAAEALARAANLEEAAYRDLLKTV